MDEVLDEKYMARAIELAKRGIGSVNPNPLVGAVVVKDGKIIEAFANDTEKINHVFDTDEGARFVGEFAIGVNPHITKPMKDILFDEKISGSIHFTPGACYEDAYNGNQSAIHWDLVLIQTPEYGGGEILKGFLIGKWIDDTQIEFTYQHLNQSLENRLGRCCTTFSLENSKLIGHEKWQWLDTLEQGSSLIREI